MKEDILDDDFIKKDSFVKENWRFFLVPIIMWSVITVDLVQFPYIQPHLIPGFVALIVVSILFFIKRDYGLIALLAVLLLGVFGILNQFNWILVFNIFFPFHLIHLFLFILQISILPNGTLPKYKGNQTKLIKEEMPIENNRFFLKFESKSLEELKHISEASQFSKEAKAAANELIKRKEGIQ